jgi:hypothetical protein
MSGRRFRIRQASASFSEEKEAKRLYDSGAGAVAPPRHISTSWSCSLFDPQKRLFFVPTWQADNRSRRYLRKLNNNGSGRRGNTDD